MSGARLAYLDASWAVSGLVEAYVWAIVPPVSTGMRRSHGLQLWLRSERNGSPRRWGWTNRRQPEQLWAHLLEVIQNGCPGDHAAKVSNAAGAYTQRVGFRFAEVFGNRLHEILAEFVGLIAGRAADELDDFVFATVIALTIFDPHLDRLRLGFSRMQFEPELIGCRVTTFVARECGFDLASGNVVPRFASMPGVDPFPLLRGRPSVEFVIEFFEIDHRTSAWKATLATMVVWCSASVQMEDCVFATDALKNTSVGSTIPSRLDSWKSFRSLHPSALLVCWKNCVSLTSIRFMPAMSTPQGWRSANRISSAIATAVFEPASLMLSRRRLCPQVSEFTNVSLLEKFQTFVKSSCHNHPLEIIYKCLEKVCARGICKMGDDVRQWPAYLERAYQYLATARRPVAATELAETGFNRMTLTQLVASGHVERPVRGVYHVPTEHDDQRVFWAAISLAYDAVFCLTSAASYHGLTEEGAGIPDMAIPLHARIPMRSSFENKVRIHSWPDAARLDDIDTVDIQRVGVRITSPARTVVDMYRHSTLNHERGIRKVIMDTAFIDCISRYLGEGDQNAKTAELRRIAESHGCWERILEISSVITTTRDRMMTY